MPEETITIGGKNFEVACQPGEEHFLQAAARMLDAEARTLLAQIGRLPEARMLLMAQAASWRGAFSFAATSARTLAGAASAFTGP
jgi:hypothetical protein